MKLYLTEEKIHNPTRRLSYTANIVLADGLATLGASASTCMVLTPKAGIFRLQH